MFLPSYLLLYVTNYPKRGGFNNVPGDSGVIVIVTGCQYLRISWVRNSEFSWKFLLLCVALTEITWWYSADTGARVDGLVGMADGLGIYKYFPAWQYQGSQTFYTVVQGFQRDRK